MSRSRSEAGCRILFIYLVCLASVIGCKTGGKIWVDRPEVFTRERLVNRRLQEKEWLEGKLSQPYVASIQGYRDVRTFQGVLGRVTAKVGTSLGTEDPRGAELASLEHEVAVLELRQRIHELETDQANAEPAPASTGDETDEDLAAEDTSTADEAEADEALPEAEEVVEEEEPEAAPQGITASLPSPEDIVASKAQLTSIESLRDEMAYRDFIQAVLREKELDDTHDLRGQTIYTLKFDVSVLPEPGSSLPAQVELEMLREKQDLVDLYDMWLESLEVEMGRSSRAIRARFLRNQLTAEDWTDLAWAHGDIIYYKHEKKDYEKRFKERKKVLEKTAEEISDREDKENLRAANDWYTQNKEKILPKRDDATTLQDIRSVLEDLEADQKLEDAWGELIRDMQLHFRVLKGIELLNERTRPGDKPSKDRAAGSGNVGQAKPPEDERRGETPGEAKVPTMPRADQRGSSRGKPSDLERDDQALMLLALHYASEWWYRLALQDWLKIVNIGIPLKISVEGAPFFLPDVHRPDFAVLRGEKPAKPRGEDTADIGRFQKFSKDLKKLECRVRPYVYSVEPKEYAQNISDVAATEKLTNLVLSVGAVLPTGMGLDADDYAEFLRKSQARIHVISREPLIVGWSRGETEFGWLVGPRFRIRDGNVSFEHTPFQHSVQVTVAVPGWWRALDLTGGYMWPGGQWYLPRRCEPGFTKKTLWEADAGENDEEGVRVELRQDLALLTEALLELNEPQAGVHKPRIDPGEMTAPFFHEGRSESFIVRGEHLWKNPRVFIGSQVADSVSVLPDMRGLVATFHEVKRPGTISSRDPKVDLTVVTSEGSTTWPRAVTILRPVSKIKPGTIKIKTPRIWQGKAGFGVKELVLMASPGMIPGHPQASLTQMPPRPAELVLRVKAKDKKEWIKVEVDDAKPRTKHSSKGTSLHFPFGFSKESLSKLPKLPAEMVADLQIRYYPYDKPFSIPSLGGVDGSFILFGDEQDQKASLGKNKTIVARSSKGAKGGRDNRLSHDIFITIKNASQFVKGFTGLKEALEKRIILHLTTANPKGPVASGSLVLDREKHQFDWAVRSSDNMGTISVRSGKLVSTTESRIKGIDWILDQVLNHEGQEMKFELAIEYVKSKKVAVINPVTVTYKQPVAPGKTPGKVGPGKTPPKK